MRKNEARERPLIAIFAGRKIKEMACSFKNKARLMLGHGRVRVAGKVLSYDPWDLPQKPRKNCQ